MGRFRADFGTGGRRLRLGRVLVLALLILTGGSCGQADKSRDRPPVQAPTSLSPSQSPPPETTEETQARAAFAGFIQTWAIASQNNDPDNPDLARYSADPLLSKTRNDINVVKNKGAVQVGAQRGAVLSATVSLTGAPPTVTLNTCLDYTDLKLIYVSNRSPVPGSELKEPKVRAVATVSRYTSGQWLVNDLKKVSGSC